LINSLAKQKNKNKVMNWLIKMFNSSLGQKIIMSLTGFFLCAFLVVHAIGNTQLFYSDHGMAFNKYAVFMTTFPLIKIVSYGLYTLLLVHIFKGIALTLSNRKARSVQYQVPNGRASSHWTSRNMALLGVLLFFFLVVHMGDFWFEYKFGHVPYARYSIDLKSGEMVSVDQMPEGFKLAKKMEENIDPASFTRVVIIKDLYKEVEEGFKNLWLVIFYVLSMFVVGFHLFHGFTSAFQTLGINHSKYNGLINFIGIGFFAILLPIVFAAMPIYFYFLQF